MPGGDSGKGEAEFTDATFMNLNRLLASFLIWLLVCTKISSEPVLRMQFSDSTLRNTNSRCADERGPDYAGGCGGRGGRGGCGGRGGRETERVGQDCVEVTA